MDVFFGSCIGSENMLFPSPFVACFAFVGLKQKYIFLWWQLHVCGVSVSFCVQSGVDDGPCFGLQ